MRVPKPSADASYLLWWTELKRDRTRLRLLALRTFLVSCLIAAAVACATISFYALSHGELSRFRAQYKSITDSSEVLITGRFNRLNVGIRELATIYGYNSPTAEDWPNASWRGFQPTASLLRAGSVIDGIAYLPIVYPARVSSFESYSRDFNEKDPMYNKAHNSIFVQPGIVWSFSTEGVPYHDTTGETTYNSPYKILTPVAQYSDLSIATIGLSNYNIHSDPNYGAVIDRTIACSTDQNYSVAARSCGAISEVVSMPLNPTQPVQDMVALFVHPIFPAENTTMLTGFAAGALSWQALLTDVVPLFVNDLDVVVTTGTKQFTFSIKYGKAEFKGSGDEHDHNFDEFAQGISIPTSILSISGTSSYKVVFYPTKVYATAFFTDRPMWSAVSFVLIFAFCFMVFVLYDFLEQREAGRKSVVLDTKRRFVRFISHEIRTPLNTVRLGMKLLEVELLKLLEAIVSTPQESLLGLVKTYLDSWKSLTEDIVLNSETAVEVLNDLLNYDKIEMGTLRLEFTNVNVCQMLKKVVAVMQVQAQQKNIRLELSDGVADLIAADSCTVLGDAMRLEQVVRNLVSNALKFTPSDGNVHVAVGKRTSEKLSLPPKAAAIAGSKQLMQRGTVTIAVKDSGAGLTPQQLDEICAEGVQFNANELQAGQGSGLGLFISKGIVEQHGGRLVVTSEGLGKGVTFTVELPLFAASPHGAEMVRKTSGPTERIGRQHSAPAFGPRRLLVVDDSPFNRKMLMRLLSSKGHVCEQAEDGQVAIEKYTELAVRGEPPDAILMDFEMPVMNGPTATARLRELGCTCLIVGVTGNVLPQDVTYFLDHGANGVLPKPLVLEDFEHLLYLPPSGRASPKPEAASLRLSRKDGASAQGATVKVYPLLDASENV